jgi:hypothetical protein
MQEHKPIATVTLPLDLTNGNDGRGSKWFSSAKVRNDVERTLRVLGFAKQEHPFSIKVGLTITRVLGKGQRLWDMSSIGRGNWKEIEDALVVLRWFVDDSPKYIGRVDFRQDDSRRGEGPCIVMEVFSE